MATTNKKVADIPDSVNNGLKRVKAELAAIMKSDCVSICCNI